MVTSKQILSLLESYVTSGLCCIVKVAGKLTEIKFPIYVNPGSSDLIELEKAARFDNRKLKELRFIADAKAKKLYVCDAFLGLHEKMLSALKFSTSDKTIVGGIITMSGGKPYYLDIFVQSSESFKLDWTFADRYVSRFSSEMEKIAYEYNR